MIRVVTRSFVSYRCRKRDEKEFELLAKKICALRFPYRTAPEVEISLVFVGDTRMRKINRMWRKKDSTTDVLSFRFDDTVQKPLPLYMGEIFISVPQAVRQARHRSVSFSGELRKLFVHGMFHLVGYDHERSAKEERVVRRREENVLKTFHR